MISRSVLTDRAASRIGKPRLSLSVLKESLRVGGAVISSVGKKLLIGIEKENHDTQVNLFRRDKRRMPKTLPRPS